MNSDPYEMLAAGLYNTKDVVALSLAGECGITGITIPQVQRLMGWPSGTVRLVFTRLRELELVTPPSRDGKQGKPNRYAITPKGLELLQRQSKPQERAVQLVMHLDAGQRGKKLKP